MEEKEYRIEMEKIETDKRTGLAIVNHFVTIARKNIDTALKDTKREIDESILNRYSVDRKILKDRRERERRRG